MVWDALGNMTETEFSATYSYAYPTKVISAVPDPSGDNGSDSSFETTTTYGSVTGLPLTTTDANGLRTEIEYDDDTLRPRFTRTFSSSTQVGSTTETIYHDEPNNYWVKNRAQIDENNWAESITFFDGLGRAHLSEKVDADGNIFAKKEFDADGRVLRVSNPYRLTGDPCYVTGSVVCWTTNVYDDASRVIEVELPDGAEIKTDYGVSVTAPIGITKLITDQAGKKRKGISDVLGRMVRVIEDPAGTSLNTDYVFDTLGNLRKTTQGDQNRYFMHDSLGRLLRAKQPEQEVNTNLALSNADPITGHNQWSVGYSYDDNGNILTTTDAENRSVTATYDDLNRIVFRNYSDSTPDVDFYYDGTGLDSFLSGALGKTTKVASSVSETRNTAIDVLGRLTSHQQITDGVTYTTGYEYNLSGALIEETYPSGRKVKSVLNNDGELSGVLSKKNSNFGYAQYAGSIAYDTNGAVTKLQLGNGRWETSEYNTRGQITEMGLGVTDSSQNLLKLELSYATPSTTDNNGSLRKQTITVPTVGGASGFTAVQDYTYDDLNRIQSATENISSTQTWKQTFQYDRYGNRRFNTSSGLTTTLGGCSETVCNPDISTADNRFSSSGYDYDKNGNLIADGEGKRFTYDAENHQTEFFLATNETSTPDATYQYDGDGRRAKKISNTETTVFVYNASGQLVAEYSTQISQTPQVSYLTADHLGSPRVITNENGAVTNRKDYTAFGEENISSERVNGLGYTGSTSETRKGYTGYEKDDESGLDFAQARYYNSVHGRYTSVDPLTASASIKNPQTFNRYSYVLNSPYKFTDPLGLLPSRPSSNFYEGACASIDGCTGRPAGIGQVVESQTAPQQTSDAEVIAILYPEAMCDGDHPIWQPGALAAAMSVFNPPPRVGDPFFSSEIVYYGPDYTDSEDGSSRHYSYGRFVRFTMAVRYRDNGTPFSPYEYSISVLDAGETWADGPPELIESPFKQRSSDDGTTVLFTVGLEAERGKLKPGEASPPIKQFVADGATLTRNITATIKIFTSGVTTIEMSGSVKRDAQGAVTVNFDEINPSDRRVTP